MIRAEFVIQDSKILTFSVEGHSGLAAAPHDVLCASVSGMMQLVLNTLTEVFGVQLDLLIEEETPLISGTILSVPQGNENAVQGVLQGLKIQLEDLGKQYPTHLKVRTKK